MISLRLRLINLFLRYIERPALARLAEPKDIRRRIQFQSKTLFRPRRRFAGKPMILTHSGQNLSALEFGTGNKVVLYFHGGAYIFGSAVTHAKLASTLSRHAGVRVISVNYRLAPENPFPAANDDAVLAYQALLEQGLTPDQIVIGGDSAGGGLALALLGLICKKNLPRPAGLFALSPWTDLTMQGETMVSNADVELLLPPERIVEARDYYLNGQDAQHPGASPLYAKFNAIPPVYLTVGDGEILLDDSKNMATVLRDAGCDVELEITQNTPHVVAFFAGLTPEGTKSINKVSAFIAQVLN